MADAPLDRAPSESPLIAQGLWALSIFASTALAARGLATSDILTANPWTSAMILQIGAIGLFAGVSLVLSLIAERRLRFRVEATLAVTGGAFLVVTFGLSAVVGVALFLLSAMALGVWICDGDRQAQKLLPLVVVTTVGAAIYAIVFTLISPIRINRPAVHALLTCAPFVLAMASPTIRERLQARLSSAAGALQPPAKRTLVEMVGLAALLLVFVLHAFLAALPERYWDPMVSHLYLPTYVAAHGRWDFDAQSYTFAFMPAAVDWIYANFFQFAGEPGARLFNLAGLVLTCLIVIAILARETTREVAIWVAALLASVPLAFIETGSLFIENTLALWITAAVAFLVFADLRPTPRQTIIILLVLAAATMSKLHGALAAVVIGVALLALVVRQRFVARTLVRLFAAALAIALVGCFPYIFAWIKTGNPVFFLYNDIFKSSFFPIIRFVDSRWMGHFDWTFLYDATFNSGRFGEETTGAVGLTILFLVPLALASAIARPKARTSLCAVIALVIVAPIVVSVQYLRYLYPLFPLIFVGAAPALAFSFDSKPIRGAALAMVVALTGFAVYKFPAAGWILQDPDFFADFSPSERRALELAQAPERVANRLINDEAGDHTRVLYTGRPYGALLSGLALYTDWYNQALSADFNHLTNSEDAAALLARWRVTHVEFDRDSPKSGVNALGAYLSAHFQPMARIGSIDVYDVRPSH